MSFPHTTHPVSLRQFLAILLYNLLILSFMTAMQPLHAAERDMSSLKGLQGHDWDDAAVLGVKHGVININVPNLLVRETEASNNVLEWTHPESAQKWKFRHDVVRHYDAQFEKLKSHQIRAYGILLAYRHSDSSINRLMLAPEAVETQHPYMVAGWSVLSPEGEQAWAACLRFLAQRYGQDSKKGQCHDWIVGNEINSHFIWHYVGEKSLDAIAIEYERALRLTWSQTSPEHPQTKIYASLDHFWATRIHHATPTQACGGRDLLLKLAALSAQHGAYPWEVAHHPYPQDLFNPETWKDQKPVQDLNTPILNFKNLSLLPQFLKTPEMLHPGEVPREREIILSEQGFHCSAGNDSSNGETLQAAAFAYAWEKIRRTPEIKAFIYHRQIDHAHEGGLKLGLRENKPGSISDPGRARKIWHLFKKAGTSEWNEAAAFALPIIGIQDWDALSAEQP